MTKLIKIQVILLSLLILLVLGIYVNTIPCDFKNKLVITPKGIPVFVQVKICRPFFVDWFNLGNNK